MSSIIRDIIVLFVTVNFNVILHAQDAEKLFYTYNCNNNIASIEDESNYKEVVISIEKEMSAQNQQGIIYKITCGSSVLKVTKDELKYAINMAVIQAANHINSQTIVRQSKRLSQRIYEDFERCEGNL